MKESFLLNARGSRILVYHGICRSNHLKFNSLFLPQGSFEQQLRLYKKYVHIVSLDDFYNGRFPDDRYTICLSFDDGFANNYKYVLPLLERYRIPATFFVTGIRDSGYDLLWNDLLAIARLYGPRRFRLGKESFMKGPDGRYLSADTGRPLVELLRGTGFAPKAEMMQALDPFGSLKNKADEDFWLQMTEEEIRAFSSSPWVTIGSHSHYHNDLARLPVSELRDDLFRSKQFLERITGKEIKALAFPYGSYNGNVVEEAKRAGFTQLLATEFSDSKSAGDDFLRERLTINPYISPYNQLHANISGYYN